MHISPFIAKLPKAELHLHLEGTVTPQTLSELSRRHTTPLPIENNRYATNPDSARELTVADVEQLYRYTDFQGFLMAFKAVTERLRTADDYELITYRMMEQLAAQNVLHAEVFVSVGVVLWRGQDFAPLFSGMERGRLRAERHFGVSLLWIFDAVRHFGADEAAKVVDLAIHYREHPLGEPSVVGFGIGGDEARAEAKHFADVYRHAAKHGLHLTAHAGETVGPESIFAALNIGAERIGHGLHAEEDRELMEVLAERQVPIEVCISSNVRTGCCRRLEDHPARRMFDHGLMLTLNSDDPAMFQTTLNHEYQLAQDIFHFTEDHLRELARNSFEASFLPAEKKLQFLSVIDSH